MASWVASIICIFARLLTGVRASWLGCGPATHQRLYFANHSSHGDFVLIWACLPKLLQRQTRPVAAADYWLSSPLRRYIIQKVFNAVLIDRTSHNHSAFNAINQALQQGDSLIIFPEGTRHLGDQLLPFKSGIYYLAQAHPQVELVPVWIENLGRTLPKGAYLPVPLLCSVIFGKPLQAIANEGKHEFLQRARCELVSLSPNHEQEKT